MEVEELKKLTKELEELLVRKNQMYGNGNINKIGEEGIIVRLEEKIERLKHLIKIKDDPPEESIEDTWRDIAGYGLIGTLVRRGKWKKD